MEKSKIELVHLLLNIGTSCMEIVYTAVEYLKQEESVVLYVSAYT
jgi:hypothetical protein